MPTIVSEGTKTAVARGTLSRVTFVNDLENDQLQRPMGKHPPSVPAAYSTEVINNVIDPNLSRFCSEWRRSAAGQHTRH